MKQLALVGVLVAGLMLAAALLWPRDPDPAATYAALRAAELQADDAARSSARWQAFYDVALPVAGLLALAAVLAGGLLAFDTYRRRRDPRQQVVYLGTTPVLLDDLQTQRAADLQRAHLAAMGQAAIEQARASQAVPHHFAPHLQYPPPPALPKAPAPMEVPAVPIPKTLDSLPGPFTLGDMLATGWRPSADRILLGKGAANLLYEVPAGEQLNHILTLATTGGGKSNFVRVMVTLLESIGAAIYLLDRHYCDVDPRTGDEWWPLALRSAPGRAIYEPAEIIATIDAATAEMDARLERRRRGQPLGPPRYYIVEEAPSLASYDPLIMKKLARLLSEARKVEMFILLVAQSALVKVLGGSTGVQGQFNTITYFGGDAISARRLLAQDVEEPPGKGIGWLRCYGQPRAVPARFPRITNADVHTLLGTRPRPATAAPPSTGPLAVAWWETATRAWPAPARHPNQQNGPWEGAEGAEGYREGSEGTLERSPEGAESLEGYQVRSLAGATGAAAEAARARHLFLAEGKSLQEIVAALRPGIDSSKGGRRYQAALQEIQDLLRQAWGDAPTPDSHS